MCVDSTPVSSCLAQWSWVIDGGPPDVAVVRDASQAVAHNWGLGVLAADVALIVAEFTSNAWTHGSVPITVTLRLQDGVLTIEVSDAGPGLTLFTGPRPLGAGGRGFPGATAIAHVIGVEGGARETKVWARLHFQWAPAETEPGAVSELTPRGAARVCEVKARFLTCDCARAAGSDSWTEYADQVPICVFAPERGWLLGRRPSAGCAAPLDDLGWVGGRNRRRN